MNKLNMESKDIVGINIEHIGKLFPNVIVESDKGKSIDFDLLKQELSREVVDDRKEKYELTWPGKKESIVEANTPTKNTLIPEKEKSVDFDNTKNIYIEGDNLEALKILQNSYLNKIKCIYIDPPYNTGNDFIYKDNFNKTTKEELEESGQIDDEGNRLVANSSSNGRFHSDWLSMMYPRLKLARNLLTDDGIIFISIDDNEVDNLRKICDEIFGEENFVANFIRRTGSTRAMAVNFDIRHDYVLIYAKSISNINLNEISKDTNNYINFDGDKNGPWLSQDFTVRTGGYEYDIPSIDLTRHFVKRWGKRVEETKKMMGGNENDSFEKIYNNAIYDEKTGWYSLGEFVFKGKDKIINKKKYADKTSTLRNHTLYGEVGSNKGGSSMIKNLFQVDYDLFSMPKPIELLKYLIFISTNKNDIILDFFSGSATTAHATMQLNVEDGGNRKYILVQFPEKTKEDSETYKAGYQTICDIGEERIRRAGKKIKEETGANIDYGFKVFKIDSSNMKDNFYKKPNDLEQSQLRLFESNIKDDRTSDDLLTQVMLDLGLTLDLKVEEKKIKNNNVYFVENNSLIACFDDSIDFSIIDEIANLKPLRIVFKDESFKNDNDKINLEEKFKKISPDTKIEVL